jgi:cysteinyl-tRNA synthetase
MNELSVLTPMQKARFSSIILLSISFAVLFASIGCSDKKQPAKPARIDSVAEMKTLITGISAYCKTKDSGFIVIPQNASELAFVGRDRTKGIDEHYLAAIDGFGVESLFYNAVYDPDTTRLYNLRQLRDRKPVLVSEYVAEEKNIPDAKRKVRNEKFICFPRIEKNINYEYIPRITNYSNNRDIDSLSDIRNYLYLINPVQYKERQDFIDAVAKTNFDLVIIDLFFNDNEPFTKDEIAKLRKKANGGKRLVICYMNVGSAENWRYYWKKRWKLHSPDFLAKEYEGYHNEFWVKYWDPKWRDILYGGKKSYAQKVINAGFDGIYLDNVEAYRYLFKK